MKVHQEDFYCKIEKYFFYVQQIKCGERSLKRAVM